MNVKQSQLEKTEWEIYRHLRRHSVNPLVNYLNWERHKEAYKAIGSLNKHARILDLGCDDGAFTRVLICESQRVVGMDISIESLRRAQDHCRQYIENGNIHLVQASIASLPFGQESFDVVVVTSVLEHVLDLDEGLEGIRRLLKKNGVLIVGYPIETNLMKTLIKILWPESHSFKTWYDPKKMSMQEFNGMPLTHKQDFRSIRSTITKYFTVVRKAKLPFGPVPDLLSYYEIYSLVAK